MVSAPKSAETWQKLVSLRSQREIVERWLASQALTPIAEEFLRGLLDDIEGQLQDLTESLPR
jgi:hypothetical protein